MILRAAALVGAAAFVGGVPPKVYVPQLTPPTHLVVGCLWQAPTGDQLALDANVSVARAEIVMLESLAGLLLRHGSPGGVGLYLESNVDGRMLLQQLKARRGVGYEYRRNASVWSIAKALSPAANVSQFVLFDAMANPQSTNVARMQASLHNALLVDRRVAAAALAAGFTQAVDVSARDDGWALEHLLPSWPFSKAVALEQSNTLASGDFDCVNDIATAFGSLSFGDVGAANGHNPGPYRDRWLSAMDSQGLVFGWPSYDEVDSVPDASAHEQLYVVCEMSRNLALLSAFRAPASTQPLMQKGTGGRVPTPASPPQKHYVAFHFTDGDNVEWIDGQHPSFEFFSAGKFWDAKGRGSVPLAWGLPTLLSDLSSTVLEQLYDTATPATNATAEVGAGGADVFVAVSPVGYGYVSKFPSAVREANAAQQGMRMAALNMSILNLIDYRPSDYDPPTSQPKHGQRPVPPCPKNWWSPGAGVCSQGCPSASQGRNPKTGRCLCGHATGPDKTCLPSLHCVGGECVDPAPSPHHGAAPGFPQAETFADVYGPYMRQPAIDALLLYPWDTGYEGNGSETGSITWVEGKPVITGRISLWQEDGCTPSGTFGKAGCRNATNVARWLNTMAADPTSSAGYSVVPVDVWTSVGDVAAVLDVVAQLAPHVEVVAIDVLVELIRRHVQH